MSTLPIFESDNYPDGRTKQSFKDSTDINMILAKAARGDAISHLQKHGAVYGDFTDMDDLLSAHEKLSRGQQIFDELPGEVRREFANNPADFFRYVNDPRNVDKLHEKIPALTKPGNQLRRLNDGRLVEIEPIQKPAPEPAKPESPPATE